MLTYSLIHKEVQYIADKYGVLRKKIEKLNKGIEKFLEEVNIYTRGSDESQSSEIKDYTPELYQVYFELELSIIDDSHLQEVYLYHSKGSFRDNLKGAFKCLAVTSLTHRYKITFRPKINGPHKICLVLGKQRRENGNFVRREYHLAETVFVPYDYRLQLFNPTRINGLSYKMDTAIATNNTNSLIYGLNLTDNQVIAVTCWGQKFIVSKEFPQPCGLCLTIGDKFLIVINSYSVCKMELLRNGTQGRLLKVVQSQERLPNYTDVSVSQSDKNIYVTQFNKLSIKVYSPELLVLKRIKIDANFGLYRFPAAIAIDPQGHMYIIAQNNSYKCRIFKCDSTGTFISYFKDISRTFNPRAIAYNCVDDNLYTVSGDDKGIAIFTAEGDFVRNWKMVLRTWERGTKKVVENPIGVTANSSGVAFASNRGKVVMYHYRKPHFTCWEKGEEEIPRWKIPSIITDTFLQQQKNNEPKKEENEHVNVFEGVDKKRQEVEEEEEEEEEELNETESTPFIK